VVVKPFRDFVVLFFLVSGQSSAVAQGTNGVEYA
jgi:hypothetical protein